MQIHCIYRQTAAMR